MKKYLVLTCCILLFAAITKASPATDTTAFYHNPVIPGDFADPSITKVGHVYYAAGTSSEWGPHYPLFKSADLINWKQIGFVLPEKSAWMKSSFWAPELYYHNNKVYVYYTVRDTGNISCIGVAVADDPEKGFKDLGPLVKFGKEAIDPFVFNDDGQLYISWKAYGLDNRPIELLASKLSADGLKLEGEPFSLLKDEAKKGMEGQSMVKRNGFYYLFYSAGGCCGVPCDYNVRVARAKSFTGPYENYPNNPILKGNDQWMCTGHGTPIELADKRWFYLYHAYNVNDNVFTGRQGMIDEITWNDATGWPAFNNGNGPSAKSTLIFPGTVQHRQNNWTDNFTSHTLDYNWQWDFRSTAPSIKITNKQLTLSGIANKGNNTGTAICVRPVTGNYEITTSVTNSNSALKGLILYGDANSAAGIGITGNSIQLWTVKNNNKEILNQEVFNKKLPVFFKMSAENGYRLRFYYSDNEHDWIELADKNTNTKYLDGNFLKQWDRCPRPGLLHSGLTNEPAVFGYFKIASR